MENKYQEALNKIIRSCCPYCYDDNGCQNCEIKQTCNATAKSWVDTIQELVDKEKPMKVIIPKEIDFAYCPKCNEKILLGKPNYCCHCGQKLDWSDEDES